MITIFNTQRIYLFLDKQCCTCIKKVYNSLENIKSCNIWSIEWYIHNIGCTRWAFFLCTLHHTLSILHLISFSETLSLLSNLDNNKNIRRSENLHFILYIYIYWKGPLCDKFRFKYAPANKQSFAIYIHCPCFNRSLRQPIILHRYNLLLLQCETMWFDKSLTRWNILGKDDKNNNKDWWSQ